MARLQDFQTVTPTSSDKILIIQSQGQGLAPHTIKMDSANPTGTGALSINRKANTTIGNQSLSVGYNCEASGNQAIAVGQSTVASGGQSHAEGLTTTASGSRSHAEGQSTIASGSASHAEGSSNTASGNYSHAEGAANTASGDYSHAEGGGTTSSGEYSHTEGSGTTSSGRFSHSEGNSTIANHRSQHVFGELNIADASTAAATAKGNYIEIVGNGTSTSNRSNARTLDWSGNEVLAGGLTTGGNLNTNGIITATFNSGNPLVIDTFQSYGSCVILGFVQGIGGVAILMQFTNNTIGRCINMYTGENFSNSNLSFTFSSHTLTITQTSAAVSTLTIIKTF